MMKEITEQEAFLRLSARCAQAEHCEQEMTLAMTRWGLPEESRARVMARLTGERYVDNGRYAAAFVRDKVRYNKWGQRKIEQALWQKHIDSATIREALEQVDVADYVDILQPLLRQKRRSTRAANEAELTQKLIRFALGRGFTMDVIRQCLKVDDIDEDE